MNSKSKLLAPELVNAERPVWAFSKKIFCEGMRDGVPIALGYFAVSFSPVSYTHLTLPTT